MTTSAMGPIRQDRELSELDLSRLAREIARNLRPLEMILETLGISAPQFDRIKNNPIFLTRMGEEAAVWGASTASSLRTRISTKAQVAVEELLHEAIDIVQDKKLGGAARIQALQFIAKMGQLGESDSAQGESGKVTINILLGGNKISFEKDPAENARTVHPTIEGSGDVQEVTPGVTDR